MTFLVLDPLSLSFRFPKASDAKAVRIRVFAQVVDYSNATLEIRKIPNIPDLYAKVVEFDDEGGVLQSAEETLQLELSNEVIAKLNPDAILIGGIVDLIGYYNGTEINVISIKQVNGTEFLDPENLQTMLDMELLRKLQ